VAVKLRAKSEPRQPGDEACTREATQKRFFQLKFPADAIGDIGRASAYLEAEGAFLCFTVLAR
jgi:hypothetical protein